MRLGERERGGGGEGGRGGERPGCACGVDPSARATRCCGAARDVEEEEEFSPADPAQTHAGQRPRGVRLQAAAVAWRSARRGLPRAPTRKMNLKNSRIRQGAAASWAEPCGPGGAWSARNRQRAVAPLAPGS